MKSRILKFAMFAAIAAISATIMNACNDNKNKEEIYYQCLIGSVWEGSDYANQTIKIDFLSENEIRWTYTSPDGERTEQKNYHYTLRLNKIVLSSKMEFTVISSNQINYDNYIIFNVLQYPNCDNKKPNAPPIENTTRYANANIKLPGNWNGTSILANSFVWISIWDTEAQNQYNVHPCDIEDPNCDYPFTNDHEAWDDDDRYYEYSLSSNVVIEAGVYDNDLLRTKRMTVNEFANYMHKLDWLMEYGTVANVTYENRMITKIVEKYIP
jgi:hypothetical protein